MNWFSVKNIGRQYGIYLLFIALMITITMINVNFFTIANLKNILLHVSITGILAVGMTFVLATGGIDMSVGSLLAFSGVVGASMAQQGGSVGVAVVCGLGAGMLLGAVNGAFVAYARIVPFIVTLGMLSIARGLTNIYTKGRPVIGLDPEFIALGQSSLLGLPLPIWFFLTMLAIGYVILHYSILGRYILATGSNEATAITSGIRTAGVKMFAYCFTGLCCGLAGILLAARTNAGAANAGSGYELDVIAAVIIGGTSLSGGRAKMAGTLMGVLILGILQNGLDVLHVSTYLQQIIKGLIIIGAVWVDKANQGKGRRGVL